MGFQQPSGLGARWGEEICPSHRLKDPRSVQTLVVAGSYQAIQDATRAAQSPLAGEEEICRPAY